MNAVNRRWLGAFFWAAFSGRIACAARGKIRLRISEMKRNFPKAGQFGLRHAWSNGAAVGTPFATGQKLDKRPATPPPGGPSES
jgi:hypothetical protein